MLPCKHITASTESTTVVHVCALQQGNVMKIPKRKGKKREKRALRNKSTWCTKHQHCCTLQQHSETLCPYVKQGWNSSSNCRRRLRQAALTKYQIKYWWLNMTCAKLVEKKGKPASEEAAGCPFRKRRFSKMQLCTFALLLVMVPSSVADENPAPVCTITQNTKPGFGLWDRV